MTDKKETEAFLKYSQKTPVTPDAIGIAQKLVSTGVRCLINKEEIPPEGVGVNLLQFQRAFPRLGFCVINWGLSKRLSSIDYTDVLKAFASTVHYQATRADIEIYAPVYGLKTPREINQFYLYDLVVGGQLGWDKEGRGVLYYPSDEEPLVTFDLKEDQVDEKNAGGFAVIHLGQIVLFLGKDDSLVKELEEVHRSQTKVWELFKAAKNSRVKVFHPVPNGQRR